MTVGRINFSTAPSDTWSALDAIRERVSVPERPPNSFTVAEYSERYGLNEKTATSQLRLLVQDKTLEKQLAIVNGKRTNVYWIPSVPPTPSRKRAIKQTNGK